jgi:hypothetical protein
MRNFFALPAFSVMGYLKTVRDETDDEGEIEAEKRALRALLITFRVKSQIELSGLAEDEDVQQALGRFIARYAQQRRGN